MSLRQARYTGAGSLVLPCVVWMLLGMLQPVWAQEASPPVGGAGLLDSMDDPAPWKVYKDDRGVKVDVATVEAKGGKAVDIAFTMGPGEWFGVFKSIDQDLSGYKGLRFTYRGQGSPNSIECKLEDADGSIVGKVLGTKSNIGSWTVVEIPFTDFSYWWGGDNKLAWDRVHNIHFAVSMKNHEDKGGSGKVSIDQVELYQ